MNEIDLRLGDALAPDGLASLGGGSCDHVICDPPYDDRAHRAAVSTRDWRSGNRKVAGALPFEPLDAEKINTLAAHFARVARRWIVIFCAERMIEGWASALERSGARFVRVGIAERTNPRPQFSGDRPAPPCDHLVIAHAATAGRMRWNGGGRPAGWRSPTARFDTDGKNVHPCQKPVALMRSLIEDFTDPGELVCDPFTGSATTAIACHQLGRRFLGWERDPGYYDIAARRITQVQQQLRLPIERREREQTGFDLADLEVQQNRGG